MIPKENILDILIYLFEHYMFEDEEFELDQETLTLELTQAGFEPSVIDRAFNWLEKLVIRCDDNTSEFAKPDSSAIRHFSDEEMKKLSVEARGMLLMLENCHVLDPMTREMVINQSIELDVDGIDLNHLKWIVLMVLSNYTKGEGVTALTETLVLDGLQTCVH